MKTDRDGASIVSAPYISKERRPITDDPPVLPFEIKKPVTRDADGPGALRVTHLCHNDQLGGGPLASFRLHQALVAEGADSRMLVMKKHHDDPTIETIVPPSLSRIIEAPARIADRLPLRLYPKRARDVVWSPGWFSLPKIAAQSAVRDADVLGLYWINGGFLSISEVEALLALGKPVVWRLSDLWAFTGGCHHAASCTEYRRACGHCPQLGSRSQRDLSARLFKAKARWSTEKLVVVSPSHWLKELAQSSAIFGNCRIEHITTGIDVDMFSPRSRAEARRRLGLPLDRTLILFGANNGIRNPKKGFSLLLEAFEQLIASRRMTEVDLVLFGQGAPPSLPVPLNVHAMGPILDEKAKADLFGAVDIFATPSLEENMPNTVIEAMACGTPAVAFDVGGTGELIQHGVNGYLAVPGDSSDFGRGLASLLDHEDDRQRKGAAARAFVVRHHDIKSVAGRYLDLYQDLHMSKVRERAA